MIKAKAVGFDQIT